MARLESINFYQNKSEIKLIFQKNNFFLVLGARSQDPSMISGGAPRPRNTVPPPLQISGYALLILDVRCSYFLVRILIVVESY